MRNVIVAAGVAALLLAGCSGDNGSSSSSSSSSGSSASSTSTSTSTSTGSNPSGGTGGTTGVSTSTGSGSTGSGSTGSGSTGSGSTSTGSTGSGSTTGDMGDWSCVGNETPPTPTDTTTTFTVGLGLQGLSGATPVEGATVKLCALDNPACVPGATTGTPDATGTSDAAGNADLTVALGASAYLGYVGVTPATAGDFMPTIAYLQPFVNGADANHHPGASLVLLSQNTASLLGLSGGVSLEFASHGLLVGSVRDCADAAAVGATVDVDAASKSTDATHPSKSLYFSGPTPSQTATSTDSSGQFGISNVNPGDAVVLTAKNAAGDTTYQQTVTVQAGGLTEIVGLPNK